MKKLIVFFVLLALFGCGSGGGGESNGSSTDSYTGLVQEDFSGKTIYLVDDTGWAKAVFNTDGTLEAYNPNQLDWYQNGTWEIVAGKLEIAPADYPSHKNKYTLIEDDINNNSFKLKRDKYDGMSDTVWMFYNQTTGFQQAKDFVNNK